MKIAFIDVTTTVSYGGIQTAVWQLARELSDLGHAVTVFGGEGDIRPMGGPGAVQVQTFPFTPRERVWPDLGARYRRIMERRSFARHARAAVIAAEFDWVILTKPFDFFWPGWMPAGSRTRFAYMSGGTSFFAGDRRLARGVDAWLACSQFNAWQIYGRYRHYPQVMYNGVDTGQFQPGARDPALRARLGVAEHEVLFTFAGRLVGWKGLRVALDALAHPELAGQAARLLVIGAGDDLPRLQAQAQRLGLGERVLFHPPVPHAELPAWYASADVGLFPSIGDEAFGITIAEAMSCGLPVIGSYVGGIPEVIGNEGSCGELVPPFDVARLAAAMRRQVDATPEQRQAQGERARQRIVTLYTWRRAAERMLQGLVP